MKWCVWLDDSSDWCGCQSGDFDYHCKGCLDCTELDEIGEIEEES